MKILNKYSKVKKELKLNCDLCGFEREMGAQFPPPRDAIWIGNEKACEMNELLIEGSIFWISEKWPIICFDLWRKKHQFFQKKLLQNSYMESN